MTKLGASKKLIITLLSIMLTMLVLFSVLTIITKTQTDTNQPQAADEYYTFGSTAINNDSEAYKKTKFKIKDAAGLKAFSLSVSYGTDDKPCTFEGKTVELTANITANAFIPIGCNESYDGGLIIETDEVAVFKGTFDGCGYKLTLKTETVGEGMDSETYDICLGMFTKTDSAIIKNLRLDYTIPNVQTIDFGWVDDDNYYIGGIVGYATNTQFINCAVDKFEIGNTKNLYSRIDRVDVVYIGGIAGYLYCSSPNKSSIKNCYVGTFKILAVSLFTDQHLVSCNEAFYCSGIANLFYSLSGLLNQTSKIVEYCIVNNGETESKDDYVGFKNWDFEIHFDPGGVTTSFDEGAGPHFWKTIGDPSGANSFLYNAGHIDSEGCLADGEPFDINSLTDKYWYKAPNDSDDGFNNGAPYLKTFLNTKTYLFNPNDSTGKVTFQNNGHYDLSFADGSKNTDRFIIADYKENTLPTPTASSQTINFFGVTIKAEPYTGYKFKHWKQDSDSKNLFYAHFEIINYTITYNLDGGTLTEGVTNPTTYTVASSFSLKEPTKKGFAFAGWTGTGLSSATKNISIAKGSTGNREYTATWTIEEFKITYKLEGGTLQSGQENPIKYNVETPTFTLNNPTKYGYNFLGWTGTGLSSATTEVIIPKGSTGDRTYTATWEATEYTITYIMNGGINNPSNPTKYTIEDSFTLKTPTHPNPTGFTFDGWTAKIGDWVTDTDSISKGVTGDITFTANWTDLRYSITFKLNDKTYGGYISVDTYNITNGESLKEYVYSDYTVSEISPNTKIELDIIEAEWEGEKYYQYMYTIETATKEYSLTYIVADKYIKECELFNNTCSEYDPECVNCKEHIMEFIEIEDDCYEYTTTQGGTIKLVIDYKQYDVEYE